MANILGLALKVTGDASGLAKSLTPVERALDNLGKQAEKATAVFQPFADKTAAAGKAQEEFAAKFDRLAQQLRDGVIAPEQYAAAFGKLSEEAKAAAAAFEEGLRVTREVRSEEERRAE
jgi:phage-related minor tail protein